MPLRLICCSVFQGKKPNSDDSDEKKPKETRKFFYTRGQPPIKAKPRDPDIITIGAKYVGKRHSDGVPPVLTVKPESTNLRLSEKPEAVVPQAVNTVTVQHQKGENKTVPARQTDGQEAGDSRFQPNQGASKSSLSRQSVLKPSPPPRPPLPPDGFPISPSHIPGADSPETRISVSPRQTFPNRRVKPPIPPKPTGKDPSNKEHSNEEHRTSDDLQKFIEAYEQLHPRTEEAVQEKPVTAIADTLEYSRPNISTFPHSGLFFQPIIEKAEQTQFNSKPIQKPTRKDGSNTLSGQRTREENISERAPEIRNEDTMVLPNQSEALLNSVNNNRTSGGLAPDFEEAVENMLLLREKKVSLLFYSSLDIAFHGCLQFLWHDSPVVILCSFRSHCRKRCRYGRKNFGNLKNFPLRSLF